MKHNLKITHRTDMKSKEEVLKRVRALKNQLEQAGATAPNFKDQDAALKYYQNMLSVRIQELSWVLNSTELFALPNNQNTEE